MIHDHDRSGYIGASDVPFVVGNWSTATFSSWWRVKQGIEVNNFTNTAMLAGTYKERQILDSLRLPMIYDRQIVIEPLKLRVNLDGECDECIYECKTYKAEKGFKLPKKYIQQVNVQMYATGFRKAFVVAYGLTEDDYRNFYLDIDSKRVGMYPIEYDEEWINGTFLPRLKYMAECLESGKFPRKEEFDGKRDCNHRDEERDPLDDIRDGL